MPWRRKIEAGEGKTETTKAIDGRRPVRSAALQHELQSPVAFDYLERNDRSWEAMGSRVVALLFRRNTGAVGDICEGYAVDGGWLPCWAPLGALKTFSYRQHFCFIDKDLWRGRDETLVAAL